MKIYDRARGVYAEEKEYGGKKLDFLYGTLFGRILLKLVFSRRYYSHINAVFMKSRYSVKKIKPFIDEYGIDISRCEKKEFESFDDFFTRKRRYGGCTDESCLIACADARLSVYEITENLTLKIKNSVYTLDELVDGRLDLSAYGGGVCLVYRLAVEDYHRYVFFDDGVIGGSFEIEGALHTVRPISEKYRVFSRNHRVCTLLETEHFGDTVQIEVGALQVGKISNYPVSVFKRLDEKGFFSYGGSTIIQLFKKGAAVIDGDICKRDCETLVEIGESIGRKGVKTLC